MTDGTQPVEQWLPVVGYDGYEVSDLGSVRSVDRVVYDCIGRARRLRGRVLRPGINPQTGRRVVNLRVDGHRRTHTVYALMLTAFVGPRPQGMEACHNDGNYQNDALSNLRWDTSSANTYDLVKHGAHNNAIKTHCPRSHRLDEPNLVSTARRQGRRDCLACHNARSRMRRLGDRAANADFRALSDDCYRRIMKE